MQKMNHDVETQQITKIDLNDFEIDEMQETSKKRLQIDNEANAKLAILQQKKQSLFEKLGITEDEAKLLLS